MVMGVGEQEPTSDVHHGSPWEARFLVKEEEQTPSGAVEDLGKEKA